MRSSAASNYWGKFLVAEANDGRSSEASSSNSGSANNMPFSGALRTLGPGLLGAPSDASLEPPQSDSLLFSALFSEIDNWLSLPSGFSEAVDIETAEAAERVLAYVESSGKSAPKMFSHGGDSIVLGWDKLPLSMYLTISGAEAAFLLVNELTKVQCPSTIVSLTSSDASGLLGYIDSTHKAATNAK